MAECRHKRPVSVPDGIGKSKIIYVPCGKCANCLANKQNDFLVRAYKCAINLGSLDLVTLTYDDNTVPITGCFGEFKDGVCVCHSMPMYMDELREVWKSTEAYYRDSRKGLKMYHPSKWYPFDKSDGKDLRCYVAAAIRKKDVQSWLKSCRIRYERKHGRMKPFKYAICPEYGGRTARPHYHLLFFGIDNDILKYFLKDWRRRFGFVDRRRVNLVNPEDKSNGFAKACAYVSKYISKGIFETANLEYVPRHRITVSKYLGLENPFELRDMFNFHLCRDLRRDSFVAVLPYYSPGEVYNPVTGEVLSSCYGPTKEDTMWAEQMVRRATITIEGFKYRLPKSFKNVLFRRYDPVKKRYTASELSCAFNSAVEMLAFRDFDEILSSHNLDPGRSSDLPEIIELSDRFNSGALNFNDCTARLKHFYQKTMF